MSARELNAQLGSIDHLTVLLDTTEQSALGWTKYPDGGPSTRTPGWVEESFTNFERNINWRSFVVCDVAFTSVNNWLWTPYIERGDANRLYIEIKFTMRDCSLFPQRVLSCKETFALLYNETDTPIERQLPGPQPQPAITGGFGSAAANASFAQSDSFSLIDAIAADEGRFTSNTDVVINTELRSIPVSKRGVYFAFRDQGACLSLISIKVYHLQCPALSTQFAHFNATPTGRDLTSLVAVEGQCVANSLQVEQPKMFCTADGQWNSMSSGQCKCLAGFEPAANQTKCVACPPGKYKASLGDAPCLPCPDRSSAPHAAATECRCAEGHFRAAKDSRSAPCTQPPGPPFNLSASYVDASVVVLQWSAPRYSGGREDLSYKLLCDNCDSTLVSSPQFYTNFSETKCVLAGLSPNTNYRFIVYAMNGISQMAAATAAPPQYSEIQVQTGRPTPQTSANTLSAQGNLQLLPIFNFRAFAGARGTDMLLAWDAQSAASADQSGLAAPLDSALPLESLYAGNLMGASSQPALYEVKYQPRYLLAATAAAGGQSGLDGYQTQRRSPYQSLLGTPMESHLQQTITTTNRALSIGTLTPRTEYAFQIRAKWSVTNQWTEFSEPIFMFTSNQTPIPMANPFLQQDYPAGEQLDPSTNRLFSGPLPFGPPPFPPPGQSGGQSSSAANWFTSALLVLLCVLISLALVSVTLVHYRKSLCLRSLAGFGHLGGIGGGSANASSSTYGGVYGSGASSDLMGVGALAFGAASNPLSSSAGSGNSGSLFRQPHQLHHATLSGGSAGGLITGSNATSRSSSGGNVVQNFIAATLHQISGHQQHQHKSHQHSSHHLGLGQHTLNQHQLSQHLQQGAGQHLVDGKSLFASPSQQSVQQQHQHQRNHYHQTTISHHLFGGGGGGNQQASLLPINGSQQLQLQLAANQRQQAADLFKYRTLGQPGGQFGQQQQQQDPQLHIYDDLDAASCGLQPQGAQLYHQRQASFSGGGGGQELERPAQRISLDSASGRGEYL